MSEENTAFEIKDYFPLNFNTKYYVATIFLDALLNKKWSAITSGILTCSSSRPSLPSSAGRSVSTDWGRKDERHLLHLLKGSSIDNLYKIYALNNRWTKHLEVIGCVKLHNRPDSLSEQSKIRLNNKWGVQKISRQTNTAWLIFYFKWKELVSQVSKILGGVIGMSSSSAIDIFKGIYIF